jgi:hypothetical protein
MVNKPPGIGVTDRFGPVWCDRAEFNQRQGNANIVVIRATWNGDVSALGYTTVTTNKETGEILDADIEINGSAQLSMGPVPGKYDLQSIITHEAGHFLGLAHSKTAGATMSSVNVPGVNDLTSLDTDDIAGICAIYPPDRSATCDPTPIGGFAPECALDPVIGGSCSTTMTQSRSARAAAVFILGLGVAVARLRPRRRGQKLT